MLRKRSRSIQRDQYKGHLMDDSASESCFQSDVSEQKHKSSSFFSVPGLFVGFGTKGLSDSESARSPTSPLDYRVLFNLGNPFRSPRSCPDGPQKSWDCGKVGLGIVDSLKDENKTSGKALGFSENRIILFGSQMRMNLPSSQSHLYGSIDSLSSPKSLTKNYAISPDTRIKSSCLHLGISENVFGAGEIQLQPKPSQKNLSCLPDSGRCLSPLTSLTPEDICADKETTRVGSPPLIGGGSNCDNSLCIKPSSLPITIGSHHGFMGSLSGSEIELSEDYTCVISHGPNPRTTHIFGDCILECQTNGLACCNKKEEQGIKSTLEIKCLEHFSPYPSDDFLSFCYSCKKKLEEGKDIYMFRGEKAFCSNSCRSQEILVEEEMEKTINNSFESSPKTTYPE